MKKSEVLKLIGMLTAAYPAATVPRETGDVWPALLADLDAKAVLDAALKHVASSKFFPSISELRTAVAEAACSAPHPDQAMAEVARAMHANGTTRTKPPTTWSHPAIEVTVKDLTWWYIAGAPADEWRREFLKAYAAVRARMVTEANQAPLLAAASSAGLLGDGSK